MSANERQARTSYRRPELCSWLMTDTGIARCWVSTLIHATMSCLTVYHPLARAPPSWAHAAPAVPAAPYKHFIPGGKIARSHATTRVNCDPLWSTSKGYILWYSVCFLLRNKRWESTVNWTTNKYWLCLKPNLAYFFVSYLILMIMSTVVYFSSVNTY